MSSGVEIMSVIKSYIYPCKKEIRDNAVGLPTASSTCHILYVSKAASVNSGMPVRC
jgi:hypothetical protein